MDCEDYKVIRQTLQMTPSNFLQGVLSWSKFVLHLPLGIAKFLNMQF